MAKLENGHLDSCVCTPVPLLQQYYRYADRKVRSMQHVNKSANLTGNQMQKK